MPEDNNTTINHPHVFEVFEGEDKSAPGIWCKHCNTTLYEVPGMHFICPICEGPTECGEPNCVEGCNECEARARADYDIELVA
jgi:hypothetical protein